MSSIKINILIMTFCFFGKEHQFFDYIWVLLQKLQTSWTTSVSRCLKKINFQEYIAIVD